MYYFFCHSQLLTNHYEQCWKYYCLPSGWGNYGIAAEEELHLSEKLFWGIFDSLSHKVKVQSNICKRHYNSHLCFCTQHKSLASTKCYKDAPSERKMPYLITKSFVQTNIPIDSIGKQTLGLFFTLLNELTQLL